MGRFDEQNILARQINFGNLNVTRDQSRELRLRCIPGPWRAQVINRLIREKPYSEFSACLGMLTAMIPSFMLIHCPFENNEDGWWGPVRENNEEPVKHLLYKFFESRLGH